MLIVAGAFEPELEALRRADLGGVDVDFLLTGIGSVSAAVSVTRRLCQEGASRLVFVGSCGSYGDYLPLRSCACVAAVCQTDYLAASSRGHIPAAAVETIDADPELKAQLSALADEECIASSPISIADEKEAAVALAEYSGAGVENLELFGVAKACKQAGIPWGALCAVTNFVGPGSGQQWRNNHIQAAEHTAQVLQRFLQAL
ncbi:MAG: hypothetical protein KDD66_04630 [Bdellovibrionales bacterium]|nr:hypothetical protein [Bdellovibrionales bacterium]